MGTEQTEQAVYDRLWKEAVQTYQAGVAQVDPYLNDLANDRRNGMSLAIYLPSELYPDGLMTSLHEMLPSQYIYPAGQLHITFLTLLPVRSKIDFSGVPISDYIAALQDAFANATPFDIHLRGITASAGVIMLQGFADSALNTLRDKARSALRQAGLGDLLDVRYKLQTAHVTLVRYRDTPSNITELPELLLPYRNVDFGRFMVNQISLVENDYYLMPSKTRVLQHFDLA